MVSFIVPIYNTKNYIKRCIDSVFESGIVDFEIILIDDGSTDGSGELCMEFANKYPKEVIYKRQVNSGASSARNKGIESAHGEWIMFLDSDDYILEKSFLDIEFNLECDLIFFQYGKDNKDESLFIKHYSKKDIGHILECILTQKPIEVDSTTNLSVPWCKLYKTKKLKENNIIFPTELSIGEDMIFNLNYIKYCSFFEYNSRSVYFVEEREGSLSRSIDNNKFNHDLYFNSKLKDILYDMGLFESYSYLYYDNVVKSVTDYIMISADENNYKDYSLKLIDIYDIANSKIVLKNCSSNIKFFRKLLFSLLSNKKFYTIKIMCDIIKIFRK